MYFLPPGGVYNDVWASTWVLLADIDDRDAAPVLRGLADADIGGYVATPAGIRRDPRRTVVRTLYVDTMQYGRAEAVLMKYLQQRRREGVDER
jgi:hypothetical protein